MSESDSPAANPGDAYARGGDGVTVAETFTDVVSRFDTATEELATTLHGPFSDDKVAFRRAYRDFAEEYVGKMREIQEHGRRLSGNVQAGAIEISGTDDRSAEDYQRFGEPVPPEREGVLAPGNFEFLNRHLNEHIDERYVPGSNDEATDDIPQSDMPDYRE